MNNLFSKKNLSYLSLVVAIVLMAFPYFYPTNIGLVIFLGLVFVSLMYILWSIEGGAISFLLFVSFLLATLNEDKTILLLGVLASIVVFASTFGLRKTIKNIKKQGRNYANFSEKSGDGILVIQDEIVKYVNPALADIVGKRHFGLVNRNIKDLPFRDLAKAIKQYDNGQSLHEISFENRYGEAVILEANIVTISYNNSLAYLINFRDILRRIKVEEVLRQKEQEFQNLVENATDVIARFDKDLRCIYINPVAKEEWRVNPSYLFWKNIGDIGLSEDMALKWESAMDYVFKNKKEKSIYIEHIVEGKKKYYYVRLLPELDKNQNVRTVLTISRNVTEIKEIDQVKSEFLSHITHQLRSPISVIRWCSVMFLDDMLGKLTQKQKKYIRKIYEANNNLTNISNTFFNVALLEFGMLDFHAKNVNIVNVAKKSIEELRCGVFGKRISIHEKYKNQKLLIKGDDKLLEVIFKGLVYNGIKYGYSGGNVWVEIEKDADNAYIKVMDDGCGISPEDRSKIFTKFFRSDKSKDVYGTGLDLYIIKLIVENLGGIISFESPNPNLKTLTGTVFYITLPLAK